MLTLCIGNIGKKGDLNNPQSISNQGKSYHINKVYNDIYHKDIRKHNNHSNFEVRYPRCVYQITYMAEEQSKHNYLIY